MRIEIFPIRQRATVGGQIGDMLASDVGYRFGQILREVEIQIVFLYNKVFSAFNGNNIIVASANSKIYPIALFTIGSHRQ